MKNVYIIVVNSDNLEKDIYKCLTLLSKNDRIGEKIAKDSLELYDEIMNYNYI
jgi:hypothetical protein